MFKFCMIFMDVTPLDPRNSGSRMRSLNPPMHYHLNLGQIYQDALLVDDVPQKPHLSQPKLMFVEFGI